MNQDRIKSVTCQRVHLSIHPSIHLFIHLSIHPSIHIIGPAIHPSNNTAGLLVPKTTALIAFKSMFDRTSAIHILCEKQGKELFVSGSVNSRSTFSTSQSFETQSVKRKVVHTSENLLLIALCNCKCASFHRD